MHKSLPIPWHAQISPTDCGPACIQMLLDYFGVAPIPDQDSMESQIQDPTISSMDPISFWNSAPDGMAKVLNMVQKNLTYWWLSSDQTTDINGDLLTRKIIWSIHDNNPCIASAQRGTHWVVVKGYDASAAPSSPGDRSYTINAIWILDPLATDLCVSEGLNFCYFVPERHIAYNNLDPYGWPNFWFTACEKMDSKWQNKRTAIVPLLKLIHIPPLEPERHVGADPQGEGINPDEFQKENGNQIIGENTAITLAKNAFEKFGFAQRDFLKETVSELTADRPFLVKTFDAENNYYYVIPMSGKNNKIHALVCIDACTGSYRESGFSNSIERPLYFNKLSDQRILEILGKQIRLKDRKILKIFPESVSIYPILVWKHCEQSMSPYLPFHLVTIGHQSIYIRIDGKLFTELTEARLGS